MQNQSELVSCGNKNLDSLLNYLLGQAKKKLNHVEYEVRVPSDLCISAFDLNVILGNLTENAIEAAEQTKDKWMSVDIYYEKGMLSMEIKNSFQHELAVEKNKLLSTKEEKGHGIGLANVRKMVEKYQGFKDVSNTNQIFTILYFSTSMISIHMIYRIYCPLNWYRGIVLILDIIGFILASLLFWDWLQLSMLTKELVIFILAAVACGIILVALTKKAVYWYLDQHSEK